MLPQQQQRPIAAIEIEAHRFAGKLSSLIVEAVQRAAQYEIEIANLKAHIADLEKQIKAKEDDGK